MIAGVIYIKSIFINGELGAKPIYDNLQKINTSLPFDITGVKK